MGAQIQVPGFPWPPFAEHEGAGASADGGVVGELPGDFEAQDAGVVVEAGGQVGDAEDGDGVVEKGFVGGGCFVRGAWGLRGLTFSF